MWRRDATKHRRKGRNELGILFGNTRNLALSSARVIVLVVVNDSYSRSSLLKFARSNVVLVIRSTGFHLKTFYLSYRGHYACITQEIGR